MDATEQARIDHAAEDLARAAGYAMFVRSDPDTRESAMAAAMDTLGNDPIDGDVIRRALAFEGDGEAIFHDLTHLFPDRLACNHAAALLLVRAGLAALGACKPEGRELVLDLLLIEREEDTTRLIRAAGSVLVEALDDGKYLPGGEVVE